MDAVSLTRTEAEQRARLLEVIRYDIEVDLTGLLEGETLRSVSTITFRCHEPDAETFVDCAADVDLAVLNGRELDLTEVSGGRIPLSGLQSDNVLVVAASQSDTASSTGILRTVDPSDGLVYVWTSLECDEARRLWACFDQPDLKAPHRFTVTAPESWTVLSNMRPDSVDEPVAAARVWRFPDTPPLSTYVVVVNAGPFHEVREQRGDHSLGLYARQSLRPFLERDATWLLDTTESGLAFFGDRFGQPFPEAHYDQVFVPNMGGAMENWGCVTWTDAALHRSTPTHAQRQQVALILLHEMAHMWFGDLVTMRWWDDLWLNEAFASWAATWASAHATEFEEAWAGFLVGRKLDAYRLDMGPATHPIRNAVDDVSQAMANFDSITYAKGQSVLRQLMAYVGEDAFTRGLQSYFRDHAWGNTRLSDLMDAVAAASGRDLDGWTSEWLDRAGTDVITLDGDELLVESPDGGTPRPHRLDVGSYDRTGALVGRLEVETHGARTRLEGLPAGAFVLPNDTDLTFASVRTADGSIRDLIGRAGTLPEPISRAVAVATAWDLVRHGEAGSHELVDALLGALATEKDPTLLEPFLAFAREAAELWSPPAEIEGQLRRVADQALAMSGDPDLRKPALNVLAACASTAAHDAALADAAAGDVDLAWRVAARRAERGHHDEALLADLVARDPDPDAAHRALTVTAARPERAAKEEVWEELFTRRSVPAGTLTALVAKSFWRPAQTSLLVPYAHRYLDEVAAISGGMLSILSLVRTMYPVVADEEFLARSAEVASRPDVEPTVRAILAGSADTLARMVKARADRD
ncbi:aminopeptidase N [Nocardioides euryhalodurans]|uniref:Aminopeptidase N n=1 Tax=Nocardioides euryhalodurans TaxID=2518370 RepID=A0A4P7GHY5_9ACTN|nr:aminopeptidase N [Nocardioides euryhalodurans]QBR91289.1 aminopeptidase N [Nocardioides euryhalodurans]